MAKGDVAGSVTGKAEFVHYAFGGGNCLLAYPTRLGRRIWHKDLEEVRRRWVIYFRSGLGVSPLECAEVSGIGQSARLEVVLRKKRAGVPAPDTKRRASGLLY